MASRWVLVWLPLAAACDPAPLPSPPEAVETSARDASTTTEPPRPSGGETSQAPREPANLGADAGLEDAPAVGPAGPRTVFVHLFEWRWDDIALECERVLGPSGVAAVQVSPPQEHAVFPSGTWWQRYQPVSYRLESRSGGRAAFASMVDRCKRAGVDIYVDAVLNHMSFQSSGKGSGDSLFTKYTYPGLYDDRHFHSCRRAISDWSSRDEVHNCDLATCPDLATEHPEVQSTLAAYLQDLQDLGVAGIRIDGAKHIPVPDLATILGRVRTPLYVFQEVIDYDGRGPVTTREHLFIGDVTEFRYGQELSRVMRTGKMAWLASFGPSWGFLPSHAAISFVDNHDNQRGHGSGDPLTHRDGALYRLALVFMLAFPYGYPQLMSSYTFQGPDDGPPSDHQGRTLPALTSQGACAPGWVCEHRWTEVLGMIGFRNATAKTFAVTHWWDDGDNRIAFGRGSDGFVVLNRNDAPWTTRLTTGMAPGRYCDVVKPRVQGTCEHEVVVASDGSIEVSLHPLAAMAIHKDSAIVP